MPEQLKLENLTHNPPSYGFDTDLVDDLDADLTKFFSQFEELDQEKVLEAITNLHLAFQANISSIQSTDTVKSIQQNFRLFALLLNDRMPPNPIPAGEQACRAAPDALRPS